MKYPIFGFLYMYIYVYSDLDNFGACTFGAMLKAPSFEPNPLEPPPSAPCDGSQ